MSFCALEKECVRGPSRAARFVHDSERHSFSGYGFYIVFHPECCPRECDGSECWYMDEHLLSRWTNVR